MDSDYNSSDLEPDEPAPDPFATAGQASLDSMLRSAQEDRKTSKLKKKSLTLQSGAPSTAVIQTLWQRRFEFFRENTLRNRAQQVPNIDDLERFITTIPHHMKSINPNKSAIAYSTMTSALLCIVKYSVFTYPSFRLDAHGRSRLDSALKQMLKDGILTKERGRSEKMWITWDIIRKMNVALLCDSIQNGAFSWDSTIYSVLFLSLQSALGCRVGEIMRSKCYDNTACLLYKDIKIKMVKDGGQDRLRALITLRALKGYKLDPQKNQIVEIAEVMDPNLNVCCVIKLLMIWAMRIGAVSHSSWEDLIDALRRTPSSTLSWTRPDFPVFCAKESGGVKQFDWEKPAGTNVGQLILSHGAQRMGLLAQPVTHDIRRGSAREAAHLPSLPGTNMENARLILQHSASSKDRGITQEYVGHVGTDVWGARLQTSPNTLPGAGIQLDVAIEGYKKTTRRSAAAIEEVCARHSLDPTTNSGRRAASKRAANDDWSNWIADKRARHDEPISSSHPEDSHLVVQENPVEKQASDHNINGSLAAESEERIKHQQPVQPCPSLSTDSLEDILDDDTPIDPALRSLHDALFDADIPANEKLLAHVSLSNPADDTLPANCSTIVSDSATFVRFFSRINVMKVDPRSFENYSQRRSFTGHTSRDEASQFRYSCPNAHLGCDKTFKFSFHAAAHYATCTITSVQASLAKKALQTFACSECGTTFKDQKHLRSHMNNQHFFVPRKCGRDGCTSQEIFNSKRALDNHAIETHTYSNWPTRTCPVVTCEKASYTFQTPWSLKKHLRKLHGFSDSQVAQYMPPRIPRDAPFLPQRCSHPDCTYPVIFNSRAKYREHAVNEHGAYGEYYLLLEQN